MSSFIYRRSFMLVTGLINLTKNKIKVEFDESFECVLYASEIRKLGIELDATILDEEILLFMKEVVLKRAKKKAMDLLIRSDKTEKELRDKLKKDGYPEFIIDQTLAYVHSFHYINEENQLENYIRYHSRGKSKIILKQELVKKGFDRELITTYLDELYNEEDELKIAVKKKIGAKESISQKEKEKIFGYLFRKGFKQSDIIRELELYTVND